MVDGRGLQNAERLTPAEREWQPHPVKTVHGARFKPSVDHSW